MINSAKTKKSDSNFKEGSIMANIAKLKKAKSAKASKSDITIKSQKNDITDLTKKSDKSSPITTTSKKPTKSDSLTTIELNNVIEHEGKYYRGIQKVDEALAKELVALDKQVDSDDLSNLSIENRQALSNKLETEKE